MAVQTVSAQDVIVKKDGSTILSKVMEVNTADIKYKKFSNQNGPTYTIGITDVMAINYENGEKDEFSVAPIQSSNQSASGLGNNTFSVNPNLVEDNLALVREFNQRELVYTGDDTDKKAWALVYIIGMKEGSIMETSELKASFSTKKYISRRKLGFTSKMTEPKLIDLEDTHPMVSAIGFEYMKMIVTLTNKSNKTIYVDLANCFVMQNGLAKPYYVPSATSTSQSSTSGGAINMGAVAGSIGVGGALGTLAGGVTMGGSNTNTSTTTTYSQRIISIPPMSSISLDPQDIGQGEDNNNKNEQKYEILKPYIPFLLKNDYMSESKKSYRINMERWKRGQKLDLPIVENAAPLSVHLTYSLDEQLSSTQSMRADFYLRQIMGANRHGINVDFTKIDKSQDPFIFCSTNDYLKK